MRLFKFSSLFVLLILSSTSFRLPEKPAVPFVMVLGVAQDGGYPQAGCVKECCKPAWEVENKRKNVSCLALVDPVTGSRWLFDATPDFKEQLHRLQEFPGRTEEFGIFLTHGHIGHYSGLMDLGREVMGTKNVPVYAMPRMKKYLSENGPWSQLVSLNNILLKPMVADSAVKLNSRITVTPFLVPHRDEFTETVGYKITCGKKTVIFIPDIDKWEKWKTSIVDLIKKSDALYLDGTFFQDGELPGVDMSKIPHPFISESMALFGSLSEKDKAKVHFIHFNHSNPVLNKNSKEYKKVIEAGFKVANEFDSFDFEPQ